MKKLLVLLAFVLTGCINQATLISQDGHRYTMKVDQLAKKVSAVIDGVAYSGNAVMSQSIGFGAAQSFGMRPTFATGTSVMAGSDGQALLVAANGDYIQCGFNKNGATVIGRCQSNKGRQFVLTTE